MTTEVDFETIDIAALTYVPHLSVPSYVSLIGALLEVAPDKPSEAVARGLVGMQAARDEAKQALVVRLDDGVDTNLERSFDLLVDGLFFAVRAQLSFWQLFEHDGVALLTEDDREKLDLATCRELAEVAGELHARMFGETVGGTDFLRMPYPQQSAHAGSRLELIEAKGHAQTFDEELVIPRAAAFLRICQGRYQEMVKQRASRARGRSTDLRVLGLRVRRAIQLYSMQVAGMLDANDPSTPGVVYRALLPNVIARPRRGRSGGANERAGEGERTPSEAPVDAGEGEGEEMLANEGEALADEDGEASA
jgi:hypothetical protein